MLKLSIPLYLSLSIFTYSSLHGKFFERFRQQIERRINVNSTTTVVNGNHVVLNGTTLGDVLQLTGQSATKNFHVESTFKRIILQNCIRATINVSAEEAPAITITADSAILDKIYVHQEGDELSIGLDNVCYSGNANINVTISLPILEFLQLGGVSTAQVRGNLRTLKMKIRGASHVIAQEQFNAEEADIDCSGASTVNLNATVAEIDCDGASTATIAADDATVNCSGASEVFVHAHKTLRMKADGASSIDYTGEANVVSQKARGASSINKI